MDTAVFVKNIEKLCSARGVAVQKACAESGAGRCFVSNISKGSIPSVEKVAKLAAYLGVTVSDLLGEARPAEANDGPGKLARALSDVGVDVDALTPAEIERLAALAKLALDK